MSEVLSLVVSGNGIAEHWIDHSENLHWGAIISTGLLGGINAGSTSIVAGMRQRTIQVAERGVGALVFRGARMLVASGEMGASSVLQRAAVNIGQGFLYRGVDAIIENDKGISDSLNPSAIITDVIFGEIMVRGMSRIMGRMHGQIETIVHEKAVPHAAVDQPLNPATVNYFDRVFGSGRVHGAHETQHVDGLHLPRALCERPPNQNPLRPEDVNSFGQPQFNK